jgi:hypothetical protein
LDKAIAERTKRDTRVTITGGGHFEEGDVEYGWSGYARDEEENECAEEKKCAEVKRICHRFTGGRGTIEV